MAQYRVCLSTRRFAEISVYPAGAQGQYGVEIYQARFHESNIDPHVKAESIGLVCVTGPEQLADVLNCFGLLWIDAYSYNDCVDMLASDYESRKKSVNGVGI